MITATCITLALLMTLGVNVFIEAITPAGLIRLLAQLVVLGPWGVVVVWVVGAVLDVVGEIVQG